MDFCVLNLCIFQAQGQKISDFRVVKFTCNVMIYSIYLVFIFRFWNRALIKKFLNGEGGRSAFCYLQPPFNPARVYVTQMNTGWSPFIAPGSGLAARGISHVIRGLKLSAPPAGNPGKEGEVVRIKLNTNRQR